MYELLASLTCIIVNPVGWTIKTGQKSTQNQKKINYLNNFIEIYITVLAQQYNTKTVI